MSVLGGKADTGLRRGKKWFRYDTPDKQATGILGAISSVPLKNDPQRRRTSRAIRLQKFLMRFQCLGHCNVTEPFLTEEPLLTPRELF